MIGYKQQIEEATRELALLENAPELDLKEELALLMQLEGLSKAREVLLVYLGLNTRTRMFSFQNIHRHPHAHIFVVPPTKKWRSLTRIK